MTRITTIITTLAVCVLNCSILLCTCAPCLGAGDFDNDGKDDIITFIRDSYTGPAAADVYVALSTGQGFKTGQKWHDEFCSGLEIPALGDFDGNGKDDIVAFVRDTAAEPDRGNVYVARSNGAAFIGTYDRWHDFFCVGNEIPAVGDFDGDGMDDIITFIRDDKPDPGQGDVYVALSTGAAFGPGQLWHSYFCIGNEIPAVGDFDGDGMDDVVTFVRDTKTEPWRGDVVVALSTGSAFEPARVWHSFFCIGNEIPVVGDFDGDGKDDIATLVRNSSGGSAAEDVYVALSTGAAFSGTAVKWNEGFGRNNWIPDCGDFTGDGMDDLCCFLHDTSATYQRGDVRVVRSTGSHFDYAGPLLGKWHDFFCILDEVPTTFAAVFPYYIFNQSFENPSAAFGCYPTSEEARFNTKASRFKHQFEDAWPCAQYHYAYPFMLAEDHLYFADAMDLAYVTGHGRPGGMSLSWQDCEISDCALGSWSSNTRRGDLDYIAFESCQVTSLDGDWWLRWLSTPNKKGPFSGLHVACGFWNNHRASTQFSLADEFALNLEEGMSVRSAWMEAVEDENDWISGHWNKGSVIYVAPHRDEPIAGHTHYDFWYHNPEYVLHATYGVD